MIAIFINGLPSYGIYRHPRALRRQAGSHALFRWVGNRWPKNCRRCTANAMALDPEKAFLDYSAADCSVQFWTANAPAVQFTSLEAAVRFAKEHGGRWEEIEITVHLPREDIVFATGKVHQLIDALPSDLRKKR
ncbi:hypothetical protein LZK79_10835 [Rhizobium leguminosarum]|nr:hypothetical protein [Rhizobium leguminosarum]UIK19473.1 hypothetical protein LZK79_10835 [Rhizobium leguminosarum]